MRIGQDGEMRLSWQPGYPGIVQRTRSFASPPLDGFAFFNWM